MFLLNKTLNFWVDYTTDWNKEPDNQTQTSTYQTYFVFKNDIYGRNVVRASDDNGLHNFRYLGTKINQDQLLNT